MLQICEQLNRLDTCTSLNTYAALITAGMQNLHPNITLYGQVFEIEAAAYCSEQLNRHVSGIVSVNYYTEMWALRRLANNTLNGYLPKNWISEICQS